MTASAQFIDGYMQAAGVVRRGKVLLPLTDRAYAQAAEDCNRMVRNFGRYWRDGELTDTQAGAAFWRTRNGYVGSFYSIFASPVARDVESQIRTMFPPVALRGSKAEGYNFVRANPGPRHGSVEHFLMGRGVREFSMADLERYVGGSPNMLAMELGRLVAQGKVVKSSRSGGVQFYQVVATPAPVYQSAAEFREGVQRTAEQQRDIDMRQRAMATLGSIPEVQAMRAHTAVQRAQQAVTAAMTGKRAAEAKVSAAQAKRDRAALMRAEAELEGASAALARAKRSLADAERDLSRLDPEARLPKRNPRRKRRKK